MLFDSSWPLDDRLKRPDVTYLGVPLAEMCNASFKGVRERILMKNIAYVGALAALMNIDEDVIRELLTEKFGKKQALMDFEPEGRGPRVPVPPRRPSSVRCRSISSRSTRRRTRSSSTAIRRRRSAGGSAAVSAAWYPITPSTIVDGCLPQLLYEVPPDPETRRTLRDPPGGRARRRRHGDRRRAGRAPARYITSGPASR